MFALRDSASPRQWAYTVAFPSVFFDDYGPRRKMSKAEWVGYAARPSG